MVAAATLYDRILRRADLAESEFATSAELEQMCRESYLELWEILAAVHGDEVQTERLTATTTADDDSVSIAATSRVNRIVRLDFQDRSEQWVPIPRGQLGSDILEGRARSWQNAQDLRYYATRDLRASASTSDGYAWTLRFTPTPDDEYTVRVWHTTPPPFTIVGSSVTVYPDEYPEFVVADVCAKLAHRQEIDAGPFEGERERIRARIDRYGRPLQLTQPRMINDVRSLQLPRRHFFWRR